MKIQLACSYDGQPRWNPDYTGPWDVSTTYRGDVARSIKHGKELLDRGGYKPIALLMTSDQQRKLLICQELADMIRSGEAHVDDPVPADPSPCVLYRVLRRLCGILVLAADVSDPILIGARPFTDALGSVLFADAITPELTADGSPATIS